MAEQERWRATVLLTVPRRDPGLPGQTIVGVHPPGEAALALAYRQTERAEGVCRNATGSRRALLNDTRKACGCHERSAKAIQSWFAYSLKVDHALEFNLVLCCRNTGKASINGVAVRQENYTGVCGNSQEGDDHSESRRYGDIWNRELGVL